MQGPTWGYRRMQEPHGELRDSWKSGSAASRAASGAASGGTPRARLALRREDVRDITLAMPEVAESSIDLQGDDPYFIHPGLGSWKQLL